MIAAPLLCTVPTLSYPKNPKALLVYIQPPLESLLGGGLRPLKFTQQPCKTKNNQPSIYSPKISMSLHAPYLYLYGTCTCMVRTFIYMSTTQTHGLTSAHVEDSTQGPSCRLCKNIGYPHPPLSSFGLKPIVTT